MSDEGFLARWSRRKAGVAPAAQAPPAVPATRAPLPSTASSSAPRASSEPVAGDDARGPSDAVPAVAEAAAPLPTLADVAALTRESDYGPFLASGVDSTVRNAAMKKLFSDPHFNLMDGLDVYIDDYGKPDPLPLSMLRQLRQSQMLGLFDDEAAAAAGTPPGTAAEASPDNAGLEAAASSTPAAPSTDASSRAEDDPDLRLQPDDDDRRPGAGEGPRA